MIELALLRQLYGNVYVTTLPDGRYIPWKPLSIEDYLEFEALRVTGTYTQGQLEDEVFRKCVLDPLIVERIDQLKAGTVSTVAAAIVASSGPNSVDELNYVFDMNRLQIQNAIHQIVSMICQAFPAYTPDDVYHMSYDTMMQRAALAEDKLFRTGFISERVIFEQQGVQPQQEVQRPEVDSRQLFERFENQQGRKQPPRPQPRSVPLPQPTTKTTIITTQDMVEADAAYTGHERSDKILREMQMVQETTGIYKDYVDQMKDGKKVVIPSHEERLRAAKARAKQNEERYKASLEAKGKVDQQEWQKLLDVRDKARARKARKRRT